VSFYHLVIQSTSLTISRVSKSAAKALQLQLFAANSGLPQSAQDYLDPATEPVPSIILQTKNLLIESVFEPVQAQGKLRENIKRLQQYGLGPLVARQQEKRDRTVEIVTVCPER
jgi:hypothetical protein